MWHEDGKVTGALKVMVVKEAPVRGDEGGRLPLQAKESRG